MTPFLPRRTLSSSLASLLVASLVASASSGPARGEGPPTPVPVGVAQIDITPDGPIRMSGYYNRKSESEGVEQPLRAEALAIGEVGKAPGPLLLLTVDNCAVPARVTEDVARQLKETVGLARERFVVSSSHTHSGPALSGVLPLILSPPVTPEQRDRIERYTRQLTSKLVRVSLEALDGRKPGRLAWAKGEVGFARNRRPFARPGVVDRIGTNDQGPVDHTLPLLRVTGDDGALRAIVVNYACHCTTLSGDFNKFCGDWVGYAREAIERDHPGAVAFITIGCGADANPNPRGTLDDTKKNGESIATEVKRLLRGTLTPVSTTVRGRLKRIELPFGALPSRDEWEARAKKPGIDAIHARANLDRLDRGEALPTTLPYVVQTWTFGDDLAMVFLAGEVVVDYARRLKAEYDGTRLWISAYCNDVPCYIASRRVIGEGGYEVDGSMRYYDRPTRLDPAAEDRIIDAVHELLPASFQPRAGEPK
jgi:hypothetical protein